MIITPNYSTSIAASSKPNKAGCSNNVSFSGNKKRSLGLNGILLTLSLLSVNSYIVEDYIQKNNKPVSVKEAYESLPKMPFVKKTQSKLPYPSEDQIGWPKNVKVLAACHQGGYSYGSAYARNFAYLMGKMSSIEKAHSELSAKGYTWFQDEDTMKMSVPVQTPRELGAFDKKDKESVRFALLCNGRDKAKPYMEELFARKKALIRKELLGGYNVADSNLVDVDSSLKPLVGLMVGDSTLRTYGSAACRNISVHLKKLEEKIRASKINPEQVEVFIGYFGHGSPSESSKYEGQVVGKVSSLGGRETYLKNFIKNSDVLSKAKAVIICVDFCGAGAFIAENKQKIMQKMKPQNLNIRLPKTFDRVWKNMRKLA